MTINDVAAFGFALEGYKISDQLPNSGDSNINYFGFVNQKGQWYIMQQNSNAGVGTYKYLKGDTAASYVTSFASRESNTYDYFYNIFT